MTLKLNACDQEEKVVVMSVVLAEEMSGEQAVEEVEGY